MHRIKYYLYHSEISNLLATIFKLQTKYLKFRYDINSILFDVCHLNAINVYFKDNLQLFIILRSCYMEALVKFLSKTKHRFTGTSIIKLNLI